MADVKKKLKSFRKAASKKVKSAKNKATAARMDFKFGKGVGKTAGAIGGKNVKPTFRGVNRKNAAFAAGAAVGLGSYKLTAARKAALRKAQQASARARKGTGRAIAKIKKKF